MFKQDPPSPHLWCLPVCCVVRGPLFLQAGEGHVLQMDMSCGAMPSQFLLERALGPGTEQPGTETQRKRGTIFGQASLGAPWAKMDS